MKQHGQVFELQSRGGHAERLWAYRYRLGGRGSKRLQRGGFACASDAADALERALERGASGRSTARRRLPSWSTSTSPSTTCSR
jgi:hypothetical protein